MFVSSVLKKIARREQVGSLPINITGEECLGSHHNSSGVTRARLMREEDVTEIRLLL